MVSLKAQEKNRFLVSYQQPLVFCGLSLLTLFFVCGGVVMMVVASIPCRVQKQVMESLGLDLQVAVSHLTWVLGTKLQTF